MNDQQKDRMRHAYDELRARIVSGRLAPGTRLIEQEVATRLEVSRTPVRESLRRLEQEGYVEYDPDSGRSGTYVTPLTQEDARELFLIIGAVEGLAAQEAARNSTPERSELADELESLNGRLAQASRAAQPEQALIFELDATFHRTYVEAGGGPRLRSLHDSIKPQADRYTRVYVSALMSEIDTSVEEHGRIVAAIRDGRADDAKGSVETNWQNAAGRLARVIDEIGERGSW